MISGPDKSALTLCASACPRASLCTSKVTQTFFVVFGTRGGAFHSFRPLLKVLPQPVWHNLSRQSERHTNGDKGFAMRWAFNLFKWHQGLQPACLIILKLNLGRRMTQTRVFIKSCLDFGSFVFIRHAALLCPYLCCTTIAFSGCIFYDLKEEVL